MNFNKHYNLKDKHAFLSASKYHWINYDESKLEQVWLTHQATQLGTRIHALAAELISLNINLPKVKKTLNLYVNDGIGFKMQPEQILYYSENCFGTADTIAFRNGVLRIHDLKTGTVPAHMEQLEIYAALFCLEYMYKPKDLRFELRLYQNDECLIHKPEYTEIEPIMNKIVAFDNFIKELQPEE